MATEAVFFDVGDVLESNPRTGWPERWARRLGLELAEFGQRLSNLWRPGSTGELSLDEIERATALAFGLDRADLHALMEDAWQEYVGTLNHELADYFGALRPRYRTGILSNSFVGAREREEDAYRFAGLCDIVIYSHEEGCLKPDPRIYRAACERLQVRPEAAILIDDLQENVAGAIAIGMQAILFENNAQTIAERASE